MRANAAAIASGRAAFPSARAASIAPRTESIAASTAVTPVRSRLQPVSIPANKSLFVVSPRAASSRNSREALPPPRLGTRIGGCVRCRRRMSAPISAYVRPDSRSSSPAPIVTTGVPLTVLSTRV
jgi:hypothetical protein